MLCSRPKVRCSINKYVSSTDPGGFRQEQSVHGRSNCHTMDKARASTQPPPQELTFPGFPQPWRGPTRPFRGPQAGQGFLGSEDTGWKSPYSGLGSRQLLGGSSLPSTLGAGSAHGSEGAPGPPTHSGLTSSSGAGSREVPTAPCSWGRGHMPVGFLHQLS